MMQQCPNGADSHETRVAARTTVPRLPLIVRSADDVQTLRTHSRAVRRLPEHGVQIEVAGLEPLAAQSLMACLSAYARACGCAEGGAAALGGMLGVGVWIVARIATRGPRWTDVGAALAGVFLAVLLGGLGKLLGVAVARLRFERSCTEVIRKIHESERGSPRARCTT